MQKITPHLWFDKQAKEAAAFYVDAFGGASMVKSSVTIQNTPSGDCDIVTINLDGYDFQLISAGPLFKFNPTISFAISCGSIEEVEHLHTKLSAGGSELMPLGEYPFSKKYAWIQDKFGLSWQIAQTDLPVIQKITPTFMFVDEVSGKAEEALNFYSSVFKNSSSNVVARYAEGQEPDKPGTVMFGSLMLEGQQFAAMDSARMHQFQFNEAISLIVRCENQEEIDYYWDKLSAVPESEQCGWLKDRFGVSWQIVPVQMEKFMSTADKEQLNRVTQAFLKMKKFNIAELEKAAKGE